MVGQAFSLKEELGASGSAIILVDTEDGFRQEPEPIGGSGYDPVLSLDTDEEDNSIEPNYFAYFANSTTTK